METESSELITALEHDERQKGKNMTKIGEL